MHKNIKKTHAIYDYHTVSNTHAYSLVIVEQIQLLFLNKKFSAYYRHIGKLSAKIFKQPNHSKRSYKKNLVTHPIICPQQNTGR